MKGVAQKYISNRVKKVKPPPVTEGRTVKATYTVWLFFTTIVMFAATNSGTGSAAIFVDFSS